MRHLNSTGIYGLAFFLLCCSQSNNSNQDQNRGIGIKRDSIKNAVAPAPEVQTEIQIEAEDSIKLVPLDPAEEAKVIRDLKRFYMSYRSQYKKMPIPLDQIQFPFANEGFYNYEGKLVEKTEFINGDTAYKSSNYFYRQNPNFDYGLFEDKFSILEFSRCNANELSEYLKQYFISKYKTLENIYQIKETMFENTTYLLYMDNSFKYIGRMGFAREVCP